MMTMLVSAGGSNVLMRDQVRCHATPVSSSEQVPKSGVIEEASEEVFTFVSTFDQQDCLSRRTEAESPLQVPSQRRWMRACSACRCTSRKRRRGASEGCRSTP